LSSCLIFGGSGFIGTHLAKHFLKTGRFSHVHIADIAPSPLHGTPGISYSRTDVRSAIPASLVSEPPQWIFNLAAIHREPGHEPSEYFETNLAGARNVCDYAEAIGCRYIYFTSSISVYGPTLGPTSESSPIRPSTPYGSSKYPAECIHEAWRRAGEGRRLIVSRPGVVYGPGDPGNIMRMIRAIHRGYFAFPGDRHIHKSYAYIYGLIDSVEFAMDRTDPAITYNYVETPTQPLSEVVEQVKGFLGCRALVMPLPLWLLVPAAKAVQALAGNKNPIHPVRVRKAATPTHIIPQTLTDLGFRFKYDFLSSLQHWYETEPSDFAFASLNNRRGKLTMIRGEEAKTKPAVNDLVVDEQEVGRED
jgi:nucleoside-diphosphate-sugar epimerase